MGGVVFASEAGKILSRFLGLGLGLGLGYWPGRGRTSGEGVRVGKT